MVKLVEFCLENMGSEALKYSVLFRRSIFFSAILYAMCGVIRLARFNVENDEDEMAHMYFSGLPSPAAAGVVVSLVIFHQYFLFGTGGRAPFLPDNLEIIMIFSFPLVTLLAGILMVSRVRYPHLPNQLFRGKKSLPVFLAIFASCLLVVWNIQVAMFAGFCGFAVYGFFRWIFISIFRKRTVPYGTS
jgi:CDP-diacylglycerol--serine O-phosphatidyltransferase